MSPKYSVIIPVYQAEETISRCVDSLLCQQYGDAELILVNDGSTDRSGAICAQYAADNPQVKYIAKENGGVSSARNAGLDAAIGKYVTFVDSDDYVSNDYFAAMDAALLAYDWDFLQLSCYIVKEHRVYDSICSPFQAYSRAELAAPIINAICNKMINAPWAKVYKRSILSDFSIRFPLGASVAEDRSFNIAYSTHIQSYCVSSAQICFISTENQTSLSRRRHDDLEKQFEITGRYATNAICTSSLRAEEKEQYLAALNFGTCRFIYKQAKDMYRDHVGFFRRIANIRALCKAVNQRKLSYPKTCYCRMITFPIRWNLALTVDVIAWKLTH